MSRVWSPFCARRSTLSKKNQQVEKRMRQMAMNITVKEYYLMAMDSETYLKSLWSLCGVTSNRLHSEPKTYPVLISCCEDKLSGGNAARAAAGRFGIFACHRRRQSQEPS